VKGMLTRLRSGGGALEVGSVDGNLDAETASGGVTLGKVLGEEVRAVTDAGDVQLKAIYAKRAELRASGGSVSAAVLSAERGSVSAGADSQLSSLDGEFDVCMAGGSLVVQVGEQLRHLRIVDIESTDEASSTIEIHLPVSVSAEATVSAAAVEVADELPARELDPASHSAFDPATERANTPDRTPAGFSALAPTAAAALNDTAAAAAAAAVGVASTDARFIAISEGTGKARCKVEVAAPKRNVQLKLQDFFARFKLRA